jgi:NarL family two-component system response regulator YdfI
MSIRVLITDDHLIVREGLRMIFDTVPNIELVGEASNGQEALDAVDTLNPDVVLMDLQMPVMDGITAIKHLRKMHPELAIIILTTYKEDALMHRGLAAGAHGFLFKDTDRKTLIDTIQAAVQGKTLLSPEVLQQVLKYQSSIPASSSNAESLLTEREIAYKLGITERTVRAHLNHIFQKLEVDSRSAAAAEGVRRGIV